MPIHNVVDNSEFPVIHLDGSGTKLLDTSTIKITGPGGQIGRNDRIKAGLQILLDVLIPLTSLPVDDPDRLADPGLPSEFWDGLGNLVIRPVEIISVTYDGTKYILELMRPM